MFVQQRRAPPLVVAESFKAAFGCVPCQCIGRISEPLAGAYFGIPTAYLVILRRIPAAPLLQFLFGVASWLGPT